MKNIKKTVSLLTAAAMTVSPMLPAMAEEGAAEYIAAPYAVEEGAQTPTEYYAPVFYENEGGPTIGVTLVGVINEGGQYFKDSDNDQELDAFEDWRLTTEERAADLVAKMTQEQRIALLKNDLLASPAVEKTEEVYDENGNVILSQLLTLPEEKEEGETEGEQDVMAAMAAAYSSENVVGTEVRSGVLRKDTTAEVGALFNNTLNMMAEFTAVTKGEPNIPYLIISNPMMAGYPVQQGMSAAAMGDGNYDIVKRYAEMDAAVWDAKGIRQMYGPQIDLITDPRWRRNATTYTEVPEVMAGVAEGLILGYQHGTDGAQDGDVGLIMKHFPGDSPSENGFESHHGMGQYRLYPTAGSLENYHLVGFQAAVDAGVAGIMPCYSRTTKDGRSVPQSYRGVELDPDEIGSAYNETILQTLLKDTMGFKGFINSDSNIISNQNWGAQEMTPAERYARAINTGCDVIGDGFSPVQDLTDVAEAVTSGLVTEEAFTRATTNRMVECFNMGMFENPYRDPAAGKAFDTEERKAEVDAMKAEVNQKSVVLMKNHENTLPLADTSKKVFVASFTSAGEDEEKLEAWKAAFEGAGYALVESAEEADLAFFDVIPGGIKQDDPYLTVIDLVDAMEAEEVDSADQSKTGEVVDVTTLQDVKKIAKYADAVHANGGIVLASIDISNPWILTNLEPYCDALVGSFGTSVEARMDVLTGAYNPTGKLPITMVSCNEVIAVNETEIDGVTYGICVSPNDVPGYDKDQYIAEEVLAQSPSGSYAYKDADGNVYAAWFGLGYEG